MNFLHKLIVTATLPTLITLGFLTAVFFYLALLHVIKKIFFYTYERYYHWRFREHSFWPNLLEHSSSDWHNLLGWANWKNLNFQPRTLISVSLIVILFSFIFLNWWLTLLFLTVPIIFYAYLKLKAAQRVAKFREQLPDALGSLSDTMRSGFSLPQAIIFVAREVEPPLQNILHALVRSHNLRIPITLAFARIGRQINIVEWTTIAEALVAQEKWGGNVLPLLEETARTMRERLAVEKEIMTLTAAGRLSGQLVSALIPIILLFFFVVSPDYLSVMFTSVSGRLLLTVAFTLQIVGFFWIRHLTRVDY